MGQYLQEELKTALIGFNPHHSRTTDIRAPANTTATFDLTTCQQQPNIPHAQRLVLQPRLTQTNRCQNNMAIVPSPALTPRRAQAWIPLTPTSSHLVARKKDRMSAWIQWHKMHMDA